MVALHKDRYVFPVKILVTRISGTGADSIFMAVLKVKPATGWRWGEGMASQTSEPL